MSEEPKEQALRFNTGKIQLREVDPKFILGIAEVMTASRGKYPEGNWLKNTNFSTPYDSAMRHLMKFWSGEDKDSESNLDHLLHVATNIMFLYHQLKAHPEMDDRLFKEKK